MIGAQKNIGGVDANHVFSLLKMLKYNERDRDELPECAMKGTKLIE